MVTLLYMVKLKDVTLEAENLHHSCTKLPVFHVTGHISICSGPGRFESLNFAEIPDHIFVESGGSRVKR